MNTIKDYHSVHTPNYHLTLIIKYKKKVITDTTSKELEKDLTRINKNYGITLQEWYHDNNHTHALISGKPNNNSKFLNFYKTTTGRVTFNIIKDYVRSQGRLS